MARKRQRRRPPPNTAENHQGHHTSLVPGGVQIHRIGAHDEGLLCTHRVIVSGTVDLIMNLSILLVMEILLLPIVIDRIHCRIVIVAAYDHQPLTPVISSLYIALLWYTT